MTLHFFRNDEVLEAEVTEVEASDICRQTDKFVDAIETYTGWWMVFQLPTGELVAYHEEEE